MKNHNGFYGFYGFSDQLSVAIVAINMDFWMPHSNLIAALAAVIRF